MPVDRNCLTAGVLATLAALLATPALAIEPTLPDADIAQILQQAQQQVFATR